MLNAFGSNHGEVGDLKENLILKTAGKIKIQIGRKFIDLLDNNGNINVKTLKLIKSISFLDEIKSDGIYYFDGQLIVSVNGELIPLTTENGTTYVSFIEKQEVSENLKHIALKNIGFLYDSLEDVDSITGSIIYVESEKALYIVLDGKLTKYFAEIPNPYPKQFIISKKNQESTGALVITGHGISNSIHLDGLDIYMDNYYPTYVSDQNHIFQIGNHTVVKITLQGIESNSIKSSNATSDYGFRLYNESGQSTLEVDNLIVRNGIESSNIGLLPVEYYKEENIILSIDELEEDEDEEISDESENELEEDEDEEISDESENELEEDEDEEIELKSVQFVVTSTDDEVIVSFEGTNYELNLKYLNTFQVGDKLQIFTEKEDLTSVKNVICCLVERNSKLNDDLVIGKIGNLYNEKNFGIISKLNTFYSSKFETSENPSNEINYPFYSESLYKNLENYYNELDSVIPPIGIIKKLIPFQAGYYYSKEQSGNIPINPSFIGTTLSSFNVSKEIPYLWYTNDGESWTLINEYIEPNQNRIYIASSHRGSHVYSDGKYISFPAGFICYSLNGESITFGFGKSNYLEIPPNMYDTLSNRDFSMFNRVSNYDLGIIPKMEGFLNIYSIDKNDTMTDPTKWRLESSLSTVMTPISSILSDWENQSYRPGYKIAQVDFNTKEILSFEHPNFILDVGTASNWENDEWRKSFLSYILSEVLEANLSYHNVAGWNIFGSLIECHGYGGYWTGRLNNLQNPSSDNPNDIGYKFQLLFWKLQGEAYSNKLCVKFQFNGVNIGELTNLMNVQTLTEIGYKVNSNHNLYLVDYNSCNYKIFDLT